MGLGIATFAQWRRGRGSAAGWAAATFGAIAAVSLAGRFLPQDPTQVDPWITKALVAILVLFPYLLFRFQATFRPPSRRLEVVAAALTGAIVLWTFLLPRFPSATEPRTPAFTAYVLALAVQWTVLFSVVSVRLWRAGRQQAAVPRRRMRLLALATIGMNLAIIVSAFQSSSEPNAVGVVSQSISLSSAALFFLGLAPPRTLRIAWRRREDEALRRATSALMGATRPTQVADQLIPHAASLVGARAAALVHSDGTLLGSYGYADTPDRPAIDAALQANDGAVGDFRVPLHSATLLVWGNPYTPFFGKEEVEELHALGSLADLALERCERFERERQFIANAAHELRTPLTTVFGLSMTMDAHRQEMNDAQMEDSIKALVRQSTRASTLIDQLLDLARIDSKVDQLEIQPVELRRAADASLSAAAPPADRTVRIAIDDGLVALGEPQALERIIVNLLTNAYHHGGHTIELGAHAAGDGVRLVVADDGPGVPLALIPDLFHPFTRAVDPERQGSGLGLAIARRLARALGGDIRYDPNHPHGARFIVSLRRPG